MATSFGWKRKSGLGTSSAPAFSGEDSGKEEEEEEGVDWLTAAKRRRLILLEDNRTKSKRLQEEGSILAENGRYWEAMKYWNEALQLTPTSAVLHEMMAQVGVVKGRGPELLCSHAPSLGANGSGGGV